MTRYELTLRDYLRIIRKRKFVIIFSFLIFTIGSFFYTSSQAPVYEASTTIKIEERKTVAGLLTEWIVYTPGDLMETQTKVLRGFPVLKRTALELRLIDEDTPIQDVYNVVERLQARIATEKVGNTNIIRITASGKTPEEAMDLANTVANSYIQENLLDKNKQARTTRKFIEEQLAAIEERLRTAEDALKSFGDEVKNISIAEDVQKQLTDLEFQLASYKQKYTEKHPKVLQLQEQLAQLEKQLKGFSGKELDYARYKREVEVSRKIYSMLREKLEEVRITEAEKVPDVSIVDPALMPASAANAQSQLTLVIAGCLGLVIGMGLAFVSESLDTSMGTIEDVEEGTKLPVLGVVPSVPFDENKPAHYLDRIRKRFFLKEMSKEEEKYIRLVSHFKPAHPVAEAFRNIKTNVKFSPTRKIILVTSAGPQEGKTTILINLGLVSAQEGLKTLLISSDLRRPSITHSFGLDKESGLSEVIMGTVSLHEALKGTSDIILGQLDFEELLKNPGLDHLWILPSGSLPHNPSEILDSEKMDELMVRIKREFDVVLFDSPPVLPVADASVLGPKVDGVVLCYEIGRTSRHALMRAKMQLETVGSNILGIILNQIQPDAEAGDIYPYYYKYRYHSKEAIPGKKGRKEHMHREQ